MVIKTANELLTDVAWWTTCERDGIDIVLSRDTGTRVECLVVASLPFEQKATTLLQISSRGL